MKDRTSIRNHRAESLHCKQIFMCTARYAPVSVTYRRVNKKRGKNKLLCQKYPGRSFLSTVISLGKQRGKLILEQLIFDAQSAPYICPCKVLFCSPWGGCKHRAVKGLRSCSLLQGAPWAHCIVGTVLSAQPNAITFEFAHVVDSCGFLTMRWLVQKTPTFKASLVSVFPVGDVFSTAPRLWLACFRGLLCSYFISKIKSAPPSPSL